MPCKAITKKGKYCRRHALLEDTLCYVHRHGPPMKGKKNPSLSKYPLTTKTGHYSLVKLSDNKRRALVRDLLRGDQDLDLGAEVALARYVSAITMLYLQAHEELTFEEREKPMQMLLNAVLSTARIVAINADVQRAANPLADAFNEAIAAISEVDNPPLEAPK